VWATHRHVTDNPEFVREGFWQDSRGIPAKASPQQITAFSLAGNVHSQAAKSLGPGRKPGKSDVFCAILVKWVWEIG
jgi:hypothetical protein